MAPHLISDVFKPCSVRGPWDLSEGGTGGDDVSWALRNE
jgi:hypothetical protein